MIKKCLWVWMAVLVLSAPLSRAEVVCSFQGNADFLQKKFDVVLNLKEGSLIATQFSSISKDGFRFNGKIDHLKTPFCDLSTVVEGSVQAVTHTGQSGPMLRGVLRSQYSLINYKPINDLSGHFEFKKGRLYFDSLSLGSILCDGYIDLAAPYEIALVIKFDEMPLTDFMIFSKSQNIEEIPGVISGQIRLSGFPDQLMLKGQLNLYDGAIQNINYSKLVLNFEGLYPLVHLTDSTITEDSGLSLNIVGNFDLTPPINLAANLSKLQMSPVITENDTRLEWTIKRKQEEGKSNITETKYLLKRRSEGGLHKDDSDLLGIKNSVPF